MILRALVLSLMALVLTLPEPVAAQQNLSVRPMRVEADVPANRRARVVLTVQNRHAARDEPLNLEVVDLTQGPDGTLRIVTDEMRAEMSPEELAASSRAWVELPTDRLVVPAGTTAEIPVILVVPPDARGAYASAVRITTDAPPTPEGTGEGPEAFFAIRFGFLIPLLTEIAGRPVQQDIRIGDVQMAFDDGLDEEGERVSDPATRVGMRIENRGRTYSSLRGEVVVEQRVGQNWRTVSRGVLPDRRILPGLTLELERVLERNLPSGEYRLLGNLSVDGRQLPRMERVIDFAGDPEADAVAFDTTLSLSPALVELSGAPGATRATTIEVGNPGEQTLSIEIDFEVPESLRGVAMGDVLGEALSAAEWTQVQPAQFDLRPGQNRNVRVVSRLPRDGSVYPNYFADIVMRGSFGDGQSAGETRSSLRVSVQGVEQTISGVIDRMALSLGGEPSMHIVQARLVNNGNADVTPNMRAELISAGGAVVGTWRLEGAQGRLLPLGLRDFAAEIDFGDFAAGAYFLRVVADIGTASAVVRQAEAAIVPHPDGDGVVLQLQD